MAIASNTARSKAFTSITRTRVGNRAATAGLTYTER